MNIEPEPVKSEPAREVEQSMETDDSLEDLCNDVMPSPTKEVRIFFLKPAVVFFFFFLNRCIELQAITI